MVKRAVLALALLASLTGCMGTGGLVGKVSNALGTKVLKFHLIERLSDERAKLYVEFTNGDRVTFDVVRDGDSYTISYGGVEFFEGTLGL